jgi:hypothetical protein
MKNGAMAIVMIAAAFGSGLHHPASAQSAVGGAKKQTALGGAVKQASPVVPIKKGVAPSISPAPAPIARLNSPAPIAKPNSPSPIAHLNCHGSASCAPKGPNAAKGPK